MRLSFGGDHVEKCSNMTETSASQDDISQQRVDIFIVLFRELMPCTYLVCPSKCQNLAVEIESYLTKT